MSSPELSSGVTVEEISGPVYDAFVTQQKTFKSGFLRFQPYNQVLPKCYLDFEKRVREFHVRHDDVWISSFPKCGTTWTQEMVWCIMNDLDFETGMNETLDERVPFFEMSAITEDYQSFGLPDYMEKVEKMTSPRIIKTHLSWDMLPTEVYEKKAKIIYVTRNPRDAVVSFYNHWKILEGFTGTFESFVDAFLDDICGYYTPFIDHVLGYWNQRHLSNVMFITYEEMKKDLSTVIDKVSAFVGKSVDDNDKSKLLNHLSFDSMKKNAAVNKSDFVQVCQGTHQTTTEGAFMRKGKTGNWKEHLTPDMVERFREWEEKKLAGSDLKFVYEL